MVRNMTEGSPMKLIIAFTIPLLIGNLFQQFYNIADIIIVGRFIGVHALAAVGATAPLFISLDHRIGIGTYGYYGPTIRCR